MPGNYAPQAATTLSLLQRAGALATYSRAVPATFDPITQVATSSTLTWTAHTVALSPGKGAEYRVGSLVGRRIIELHIAPAGGTVPLPGDTVQWAGNSWTIFWTAPLDPAGNGPPYCLAYAER